MKIIVPIKVASTLEESARLRDDEIDPASLEWDVNEWDMFALEEAITLRDEHDHEGEVIVVSLGGEEVGDGLLTCLAMGADRAVHVEVDENQAAQLDAIAVARLLARVVEPEAPDLILCGVQSSDHASAAVGSALAGLLDVARVAVVREIEPHAGGFTVSRELEGGLIERLRVSTPVLLTVQTGINEPRYATLRGIRQARDKPRVTVTPEDLGIDSGDLGTLAGARPAGHAHPPEHGGATILEGDSPELAAQIATIIKAKVGA